jgi:predicted GNAT superfamily acetyltransferase
MPAISIADVNESMLTAILAMNDAEIPRLGPADREKLAWFAAHACRFRVALAASQPVGFLVGLRPGLDYASPNYRWFEERYPEFGYIDRVAVHPDWRRRGIAARLYADFEAALPTSVPCMTCEVNIDPPNPASLGFHERMGFRAVGKQFVDGGRKEVALMVRFLEPGRTGPVSGRPPA